MYRNEVISETVLNVTVLLVRGRKKIIKIFDIPDVEAINLYYIASRMLAGGCRSDTKIISRFRSCESRLVVRTHLK